MSPKTEKLRELAMYLCDAHSGKPGSWETTAPIEQDAWLIVAQAALGFLAVEPVSMLLWCPECGERHVDNGKFALTLHHTHACQECGHVWRPAIGPTCGVQFLPGFKSS